MSTNVDESSEPVRGLDDEARSQFSEPSYVDLLKQELTEITDATDVMIPVVGYEKTGLRVKYGLPESGKQLDGIARKVSREFRESYERNLYTTMDTMIFLCQGLYVQPPGVDEPVMVDPDGSGEPAHFDERLAKLVGIEDPSRATARQVVTKLFGGKKNEMAILMHAEKLNRWLQNTRADLSLELWQLGEA